MPVTAQIGDQYKYKGKEYNIVARRGTVGIHPMQYGIEPKMAGTACWNGYWCVYNITDDGIYLEELYVNAKDGHYPPIEGVRPDEKQTYMGHHRYKGLHIRVPFTGRILMGDGFLHEYYIHMGYQRPWAYKELL